MGLFYVGSFFYFGYQSDAQFIEIYFFNYGVMGGR